MTEADHPLANITIHLDPALGKQLCGKQFCRPGWYWDHQTPFADYDIFYVISGRGTMSLGEEQFTLQKKTCIIMRPGDKPKATQDPNDRLVVIYMHFSLTAATPDLTSHFPFPRCTVIGEAFDAEGILYRIMELLQFPIPLQSLEFDSLMKHFFANLFRVGLTPDPSSSCSMKQLQKTRKVMAVIRQLEGIEIDIEQVALTIGMSSQYMSRLFKTCTGITLKQFIATTKLERAKELLVETRMNISEVADYMGYSDAYAFSKSFKQTFAISPSQYLASIRPYNEA